jgi:molecular chaperone Hsp33
MEDYIIRATAARGTVRAIAATTKGMVSLAKELHGLTPVASAALGRTMSAAALMSRVLKSSKDTITIQIKTDGPLGGIVVVTDSQANIRGYVYNPNIYLPLNEFGKLDVSGAVGKTGYLNVIKDLGMKEPYIGYVDLISGEIGEDIAYYFAYSEQIPTIVSLGVLVAADESILNAGGYLIQLMPGADENIIDYLEDKVNSIPAISKLLHAGKSPENILEMILGEKDLIIADKSSCNFKCNCSRDRMERNMISLGKKEIMDMITEQHSAELQCHFCNAKYQFSEAEMRKLVNG